MAPANASSGESASETAAAEDWPDGRADAARAGTCTGNGNDDCDEGGSGEDAAQHTPCSTSSSSRTGRHANACDDEDLDARNAIVGSNVSAADSSEGEEKKEEEEEMGAAAAAADDDDAVTTSSTQCRQ